MEHPYFKDRQEQRKVVEIFDSVVQSLIPHLKPDEAEYLQIASEKLHHMKIKEQS